MNAISLSNTVEDFVPAAAFQALSDFVTHNGTLLEEVAGDTAKMLPAIFNAVAMSLHECGAEGGLKIDLVKRTLASLSDVVSLPKVKQESDADHGSTIQSLQVYAELKDLAISLGTSLERHDDDSNTAEWLASAKKSSLLLFGKLEASPAEISEDLKQVCQVIWEEAVSIQRKIQDLAQRHAEEGLKASIATLQPLAGGIENGSWKADLVGKNATMKHITEVADKTVLDDKVSSELDSAFRSAEKERDAVGKSKRRGVVSGE